jgi:cell division protein FtsL
MNAAARLVHQYELSTCRLLLSHLLTRRQLVKFVLMCMVLLSALSVVYMTHHTRELQANYQHTLIERSQLQTQRGQLLLERSTWMMQARIQQIAEKKLGMIVPEQKTVVVVRE